MKLAAVTVQEQEQSALANTSPFCDLQCNMKQMKALVKSPPAHTGGGPLV